MDKKKQPAKAHPVPSAREAFIQGQPLGVASPLPPSGRGFPRRCLRPGAARASFTSAAHAAPARVFRTSASLRSRHPDPFNAAGDLPGQQAKVGKDGKARPPKPR